MVLCFDIGGTSIKHGIARKADDTIEFVIQGETPTNAKTIGGAGIERWLLEMVDRLCTQYPLDGIAISTAGVVDHRTGAILYANDNIPGYTGRNLKAAVEQRFGLPCAVENDVNCAALGELIYGAGRGADSALCLTVGTGVGGAVVFDGHLWHGHTGRAGEIGYIPLSDGTLESCASTTALVRRVAEKTGETLDGRQIFARGQAGDIVCVEAIDALCAALAQGIASGLWLFDPAVVILGGGIMAQEAYLRPRLERQLQRFIQPVDRPPVRLVFAALGNSAGMAGAYHWLTRTIR